jgi:hypothetical protein
LIRIRKRDYTSVYKASRVWLLFQSILKRSCNIQGNWTLLFFIKIKFFK